MKLAYKMVSLYYKAGKLYIGQIGTGHAFGTVGLQNTSVFMLYWKVVKEIPPSSFSKRVHYGALHPSILCLT